MTNYNREELEKRAQDIRINALKAIHAAGSGHPGGSLSCADILTALYFEIMNVDPADPAMAGRDKVVLSKGHAAPALYAALAERGFFDAEEMMSLRKLGSPFQGHPNMHRVPGVEMSTGSLGQGFSAAVGMATVGKIDRNPGRVFVLTGDGELQEGIVWEAAMSAGHRGLDNFFVFVDLNGLQIDGRVNDVKSIHSVCGKFEAFGFETECIDGHNFEEILGAYEKLNKPNRKPKAIICRTHKGQGVSFMTDQAGWHGKAPNDEQFEQALRDLEAGIGAYEPPKGCHPLPTDKTFCGKTIEPEQAKGGAE